MASYRFCRSDDLPLLARAHEVCFRPHFPDVPQLDVDGLRRASRELDVWASSCMVATEPSRAPGAADEPIAVLLATKRDDVSLIWRVGVHPDHRRRGHGRHLVTSLAAKLAILGPPRLVAEVPANLPDACAFFESCGWRRETTYTDYIREASTGEVTSPSDLVIPVTIDDLVANGAFDPDERRCWNRSPATLTKRKDAVGGLAVASDVRIEAWLLHEPGDRAGERRILGAWSAEASRRDLWVGLLLRRLADSGSGRLRFERVRPDEMPSDLLRSWGFEPAGETHGYATTATPA